MTRVKDARGFADDVDAVKVLDHIVRRAAAMGASDIHLEPRREALRVRFRLDGVMVAQGSLPLELAPPITSRVKVLSRIDMTERRLPQDGQFSLELGDGELVHLRTSTFPAIHGETVVLRLLLGHQLIAAEKLGMDPADLPRVARLVQRPAGLLLVCGPTGSGKTSTLYSLIRLLDTAAQSVVTLEDPIEVEFSDITQGQANPRQGFTFAVGLRAILRQDPDVILVGEMRDSETAQIALQASLTGHLVLSTLHTSSTIETIVRVVDLGVESWIVANSLLAVVAQRLVRVLCETCREPYDLGDSLLDENGAVSLEKGTPLLRPKGCNICHGTGYKGRTGIFEVLEIDDELRDLVKARAAKREYIEHLKKVPFTTVRESGLRAAREGRTSLEEVLRVT